MNLDHFELYKEAYFDLADKFRQIIYGVDVADYFEVGLFDALVAIDTQQRYGFTDDEIKEFNQHSFSRVRR